MRHFGSISDFCRLYSSKFEMQGVPGNVGSRDRGRTSPGRSKQMAEQVDSGARGRGWRQNGGSRFPLDMDEWPENGLPNSQTERSKRVRSNTGGDGTVTDTNLDVFDLMNVDDKLRTMMRKLSQLDDIETTLKVLNVRVDESAKDVHEIREVVDVIDERLKYVEYRALDLEARSRRNNLVFFGLREDINENCDVEIRKFISRVMNVPHGMYIQRAHRLAKIKHSTRGAMPRPRPIIVAFRDYADLDSIMRAVSALKGTGYSVSRDYPIEINEARKKLSPLFKVAKDKQQAPKIMYPAKLVINRKVVRDEFPDWHSVLYQRNSRVVTASIEAPPTDEERDGWITARMKHSSGSHVGLQRRGAVAPPTCVDSDIYRDALGGSEAPPTGSDVQAGASKSRDTMSTNNMAASRKSSDPRKDDSQSED
jgi:hypothetical protein